MESSGRNPNAPKRVITRRRKPAPSPFVPERLQARRTVEDIATLATASQPRILQTLPKPAAFVLSSQEAAILAQTNAPKRQAKFVGPISQDAFKQGYFPGHYWGRSTSTETNSTGQDTRYQPSTTGPEYNERDDAERDAQRKRQETADKKVFKAKAIKTPEDMIKATIWKHNDNPEYQTQLRQLLSGGNTACLFEHEVKTLESNRASLPHFLYRTYSLKDGIRRDWKYRRTNGDNGEDGFLPAADANEEHACQPSIGRLQRGPGLYMIGHHLMWHDQKWDEFLSWTSTLLFAIEHALGRMHKGETDIYIAMLDTRETRSPSGHKAAFYSALDLYAAFGVASWKGWKDKGRQDLFPRKFTHEYLSHGTVLTNRQGARRVSLTHLIEHGLFEVFPEFEVPAGFETSRLYTRLIALRNAWFPPLEHGWYFRQYRPMYSYDGATKPRRITLRTMEVCEKLVRGFAVQQLEPSASRVQAPLHALLSLLAMQKRKKCEPVLIQWVKDHYTAEELVDGYRDTRERVPRQDQLDQEDQRDHLDDNLSWINYQNSLVNREHAKPGYEVAPANLPECIQYLDLVRQARVALNTRMIPKTILRREDSILGENYERHDAELQKRAELYMKLSSKELLLWAKRVENKGKSEEVAEIRARALERIKEERQEAQEGLEIRKVKRKKEMEEFAVFQKENPGVAVWKKPRKVAAESSVDAEMVEVEEVEIEVEEADAGMTGIKNGASAESEQADNPANHVVDEEKIILRSDLEVSSDPELPLFVQDWE